MHARISSFTAGFPVADEVWHAIFPQIFFKLSFSLLPSLSISLKTVKLSEPSLIPTERYWNLPRVRWRVRVGASACLRRPNLISYARKVSGTCSMTRVLSLWGTSYPDSSQKILLCVSVTPSFMRYWFQTDAKARHLISLFKASKFLGFRRTAPRWPRFDENLIFALTRHLTLKYKPATSALDSEPDNLWWNWVSESIFCSLSIDEMVQSFTSTKLSQEPSHQSEKQPNNDNHSNSENIG